MHEMGPSNLGFWAWNYNKNNNIFIYIPPNNKEDLRRSKHRKCNIIKINLQNKFWRSEFSGSSWKSQHSNMFVIHMVNCSIPTEHYVKIFGIHSTFWALQETREENSPSTREVIAMDLSLSEVVVNKLVLYCLYICKSWVPLYTRFDKPPEGCVILSGTVWCAHDISPVRLKTKRTALFNNFCNCFISPLFIPYKHRLQ